MASENRSDALASLEKFVTLEDIVPKLETVNTPVEFEVSRNLLIPGVVIDDFDDHVLHQSIKSNEIFDENDKVGAVTQPVHLHDSLLYIFEIAIPENLHQFANDLKVHEGFHKTIGEPYMSYDAYRNCLVIKSSEENCQSRANMLLKTHFKKLTQGMLWTKSREQKIAAFAKMQRNSFEELFKVNTNLLNYVIGKKGKNIKKVENIPGILFVSVLKDTNIVQIYAQTKAALQEAYMYLKLERETLKIPNQIISRVIGKNGSKIQEIADDSKLRYIIVNENFDTKSDFVVVEFIGISQSIEHAKILLQYHLSELELYRDKYNRRKQYMTAFKVKNFKSPAEDASSTGRGLRRVFSGRQYAASKNSTGSSTLKASQINSKPESINAFLSQDRVYYNNNFNRGRRPSAGSRGRSSGTRPARGIYGHQTTQFNSDRSEIEVSTNETVIPTLESTN